VISRLEAPTQYSPLDSEAEQAAGIVAATTGLDAPNKSTDAAAARIAR